MRRGATAPRLALVAFLLAALVGARVPRVAAAAPAAQEVSVAEVRGGGWDELGCLSCAGAILIGSGGSIGGVLVGALFFGDVYAGCAYLCYRAFS